MTLFHHFFDYYVFDFTSFYRLGQKYKSIFVHFLAQMKSLKFAFKINWPLVAESKDANVIKVCHGTLEYSIYGKARVQNLSDIFAYELFFFSFWKIVFAKLVSDFLYKRSVNIKSIFLLKHHSPKKWTKYLTKLCPMKLVQNFVKYFVSFVGNGVSKKFAFEIYRPLVRNRKIFVLFKFLPASSKFIFLIAFVSNAEE